MPGSVSARGVVGARPILLALLISLAALVPHGVSGQSTQPPCPASSLDQTVSAYLGFLFDSGSCKILWNGNTNAAVYSFNLDTSSEVSIELTSSSFLSYVYVIAANRGSIVAEDEARSLGSAASIETTLASGLHYLVVTTQDAGEQGLYTLTFNATRSQPQPDPPRLTAVTVPAGGTRGSIAVAGGTLVSGRSNVWEFDDGERATVRATARSGWRFVRWTGAVTGPISPNSVLMDRDRTVTAHFERVTHTLRAMANPSDGSGGYVEIIGGTLVTAGTKRFNQGARATVEARPNSGWRFVRWSGDLSGSTARQSLTMNANKTVTALFQRSPTPPTPTLRAIANPSDGSGGHVEIIGGTLVTAGTKRFNQGARATVEARPNSGWRFVRWSGDLSGSTARQSLTMNANKTVTALFQRSPTPPTPTLRAIANPSDGSGGHVEIIGGTLVTAGTKRFNQGARATVEARPNSGWRFVRWSGDLSGSTARQSLTMNANKTVTALFQRSPTPPTPTLRAIANPSDGSGGHVEIIGGTLVTAGTKRFNQGARATVEARPNSGWRFVRWSGDLSGSTARQSLTMNANKTVTALFELEQIDPPVDDTYTTDVEQHTLTTIVFGQGRVEPTGSTLHDHGAQVELRAFPAEGYELRGWSGSLIIIESWTTITMDQSHTLYATFVPSEVPSYTLTTSTTGSGSVSGAGLYKQNQQAMLQTYPELGYVFDRWRGHASGDDNPLTITMDADKSVEAVFVRDGGTSTIGPNRIALRSEPLLATAETSDVVTLRATVTNSSGGRVPDGTPVTIVSQNDSVIVGLHRGALTTRNGEVSARFVVVSLGQVVILTTMPGTNSFRVDTVIVGEQARYQVQATPSPLYGGRIDGTGAKTTGDRVRLQAIANDGFRFVRWEGARSNTQNPLSLPVNRDMSFRAVFERDSYLLTASAEPADSISGFVEISGGTFVRPGQKRFDAGERALINARSNPGWEFVGWSGDVTDRQAPAQSILMDRDKSVIARWQLTGPRFSSPVSNQTWGVGTPIAPLVLPIASGGAGGFTYSLKHEWDGAQAQGMPQGLTFDSRTRTITGTPRDLRPNLRQFTIFYKVEDRNGAYDELAFVVTLKVPASTQSVVSQAETSLTARIAARRLSDGRIEFALQPEGGQRLLPMIRMFSAKPHVGRWLDTSDVINQGVNIGRVSALRRPDGTTEFTFLTASGERISPRSRVLPAGRATTGWIHSGWFEIPALLVATHTDTAIPPNRDRQLDHTTQDSETTIQSSADWLEDAPPHTVQTRLRARYHENQGRNATIEIRVIEVREGAEHEIKHNAEADRHISKARLERASGHWVPMYECLPVSNWSCVFPMVRLSEGGYEFAVSQLAVAGRRVPTSAFYAQQAFENEGLLGLGNIPGLKLLLWKETGNVEILPVKGQQIYDFRNCAEVRECDIVETADDAVFKSRTQFDSYYRFDAPEVQRKVKDVKEMQDILRDLGDGDDALATVVKAALDGYTEVSFILAVATGDWQNVLLEWAKASGYEPVKVFVDEVERDKEAKEVAEALNRVYSRMRELGRPLEEIEEHAKEWKGLTGQSLSLDNASAVRQARQDLHYLPAVDKVREAADRVRKLKEFVAITEFSTKLFDAVGLDGLFHLVDPCNRPAYQEDGGLDCEQLLEDNKIGLRYRGSKLSAEARDAVDAAANALAVAGR